MDRECLVESLDLGLDARSLSEEDHRRRLGTRRDDASERESEYAEMIADPDGSLGLF